MHDATVLYNCIVVSVYVTTQNYVRYKINVEVKKTSCA